MANDGPRHLTEFNTGEHTDAAAMIEMAAPATKSMAEPTYEELGLVRIQLWQEEVARWPELGTASTSAAAGARAQSMRRYGVRDNEVSSAMASWEHAEHNYVLGLVI